ncbi:NACHT domain-containing protein [Streptomyces lavendulae]|uniref:NACHT domain-containing protein n=1 Tax=Streptomyces lavendulae TaxID=1914 RepID=UPI00368F7A23
MPQALVARAVSRSLALYDLGDPSAPPEFRNVKRLRDHISHGGPLPTGHAESATLDSLVSGIAEAVTECLDSATLRVEAVNSDAQRPVFSWGQEEVPMWPLVFVTQAATWHLYSRSAHGGGPGYMCFDTRDAIRVPSDESLVVALDPLLKPRRTDRTLRDFVEDAGRDLKGFAEEDTEPLYAEREHGFEYCWDKATSDGTMQRRDYFRLGPDNTREWQDEDCWVPYSRYLRKLANWQVVATRFRQRMEQMETRLAQDEHETLGWPNEPQHSTRMARVVVSDMDGSRKQPECSFADLVDSVDKDLQANRGQTQVVFINGEAGIGKTRAMVDAARSRARQVEQEIHEKGSCDLPLFLYVRSTGHVLDSLTTVVNGAVTATRNLTDGGVKALCRNGLMILLIDGFDELLGGAGYSDALGSLRPWLSELGGRGVVVVSARSSYYMGQYRASAERATEQGMPFVQHRIAEVQRWRRQDTAAFLADYGVPASAIETLSPQDRELLGLPFFARAFAEIQRGDSGTSLQNNSLTQQLLSQYVAREERKLAAEDGNGALLDRGELNRVFELVAETMAGNEEREAAVSDLEDAAEQAIVAELSSRKGLQKRLPVLCGLTGISGDASSSRFQFQHELFFDQFLAGAIGHYLREGQLHQFERMLKESHWRSATVVRIVAAVGPEVTSAALAGLRTPTDFAGSAQVVSTNLGALWTAVIRATGRMPDTDIAGAVFSEELDLSLIDCPNGRLINCEVDSLVLPSGKGWKLSLQSTPIKHMRSDQPSPDLSGLRGVLHKSLAQLLLRPETFADRTDDVLKALRTHGVHVVDADPELQPELSALTQASLYYLGCLSRRAEHAVVLRHDNTPEDSRLTWALTYGAPSWRKFIKALTDASLAVVEPFSASGERKQRLRLKVNASTLRVSDGTRSDITEFWRSLEGRK